MKKIFSLLAAVLMVGSMWASQADTLVFSTADGWNAITVDSAGVTSTGANYGFRKGNISVTGTIGFCNVSSKKMIVYKNGTMVIAATANIDSIKITYNNSCYPFAEALPEGGSATSKTSAITTVSYVPTTAGTSCTFTNAASGKTEVRDLTVYYAEGSTPVVTYDTWTVAGSLPILNGTAGWAQAETANDMTTEDGVNYTLTVTEKTLEVGTTYEYKFLKDHAWTTNFPSSNAQLTVDETAVYTIVYNANVSTQEYSAVATKTGEAGEVTHVYNIAGSDLTLFGGSKTWDETNTATDMTKNESDGLYYWQNDSVALAAGTIQYKVLVDHGWSTSYGDASTQSGNAELVIPADSTYKVVITFNADTKAVAAVATPIYVTPVQPTPAPAAMESLIQFTETASAGALNGKTLGTGFTLTVTDTGSKISVDANIAMFGTSAADTIRFANRMKTGGKSSASSSLSLVAPKDGKLTIYARTGSNGATDRNVVVTNAEGTEIINHICLEADTLAERIDGNKVYLPISADITAGTYAITYPTSSINFYGFKLDTVVAPQPEPEPVVVNYYIKHPFDGSNWEWKQMTEQVDAIENDTVYYYNAAWQGTGANINTVADDAGQKWFAAADMTFSTEAGLATEPAAGTEGKFIYNPHENALAFMYTAPVVIPSYTVGELLASAPEDSTKILVRGVVTKMQVSKSTTFTKYKSAMIWVADTAGVTDKAKTVEFYNCYSLNVDSFTVSSPVAGSSTTTVDTLWDAQGNYLVLGDTVTAEGLFLNYSGQYELIAKKDKSYYPYLTEIKHVGQEPEPVATTDLYVIGTINNWAVKDANYKMTAVTDGEKYTFDFGATELVGQNFKINDGSWTGSYNLGSSEGLKEGTINLVNDGNSANINVASNYSSATNVVITIEKDAAGNWTLTAAGTFVEGEAAIPDLYLRGINGSWTATEANKFAKDENSNTWTLTLDITASDMFKVADANWGSYNFGSDASTAVVPGTAYTLVKGSNSNLWIENTPTSGNYTFTVVKDGESWTLTVTDNSATNVIENADAAKAVKMLINGQIVIRKGDKLFNAQGVEL